MNKLKSFCQNSSFSPLVIFLFFGLITHFQTLRFGLFGDDWQSIYMYLSQDQASGFFGNLPGILKYLTEYGGQVFLTGNFYKIFGYSYLFYYLVSLIFKTLAAFSLYLAVETVSKKHQIDKVALLGGLLLLAGFTGIQTTDFVVQMGVFLSTSLSFLSIHFLLKKYTNNLNGNMFLPIALGMLSIIISPYRLFGFILVFPLLVIILWFYHYRKNSIFKSLIAPILIWSLLIFIFWYIGLFSSPGQISLPYISGLKEFLNLLLKKPTSVLFNSLQWLGATIIPDEIIKTASHQTIIGSGFLGFMIFSLYLARKQREKFIIVIISIIPLAIFFILMFAYNSNRLMSSQDRYLILIFYSFCFSISLALANIKNLSTPIYKYGRFFLILLIILHFISLQKLYKFWITNGRSANFILSTQKILMQDFNSPINSQKIIFLQSDNPQTLYYIQYGLDFKILILSRTLNQKYFPLVLIDKNSLYQTIEKIDVKERKKAINNVYSYSIKNGVFSSSTLLSRKDLLTKFQLK